MNLALAILAIKAPENRIHVVLNSKFYFLEFFFNCFTPTVVFHKRTDTFGVRSPKVEKMFDKNHGVLLIDFKLPEGNLKYFFSFFGYFIF